MLTKTDFKPTDSHFTAEIDGFKFSVEPSGPKGWRLVVYGALAEVPASRPGHPVPTEKEWEALLKTANALASRMRIGESRL